MDRTGWSVREGVIFIVPIPWTERRAVVLYKTLRSVTSPMPGKSSQLVYMNTYLALSMRWEISARDFGSDMT